MRPTALIAEDEPILAEALSLQLQQLWPDLQVLTPAMDGDEVVERALSEQPDILFMDIRMPGRNGLDAAEAITDAWPVDAPLPLLVFVTAYDEHAMAAFERHAVDYVLKPVQTERLAATCQRLQRMCAPRAPGHNAGAHSGLVAAREPEQASLDALRALLEAEQEADTDGDIDHPTTPAAEPSRIRMLQVAVGSALKFVPIESVHYFEAADKYVRAVTAEGRQVPGAELLLRTPLRELIGSLDPEQFWQIHRGIVVNIAAIDKVTRINGRLRVHIRGQDDTLEVSRMFSQRFRAM